MADESGLNPFVFPLQGGLVLDRSTFTMKPGMALELQNFEADIDFEDITIGGNSIGSVYMTDLRMTGNALVYGH